MNLLQRRSQPSTSRAATAVVVVVASMVAATAPAASAARVDASNADRVDGRHAVGAGARVAARKGKLVATNAKTGRLPNNIIARAPNSARLAGRTFRQVVGTARKLPAGSVTTARLADGSVTATKLAPNTVWQVGGNPIGNATTQFLGTTTDQPLEMRVNDQRVVRLEPALRPNVIGGWGLNAVSTPVFGATISGGGGQTADVSGDDTADRPNQVTDHFGTVGGGLGNVAGDGDPASSKGHYATVAGGERNEASGRRGFVGGGLGNVAAGEGATVGGGFTNEATGTVSSVLGGSANVASGSYAHVAGGLLNAAAGTRSYASGTSAKALHDGSFVWGDNRFAEVASTGTNQFVVRAFGGVWLGTTSTVTMPEGRFLNTSTGGYLSTGGVWTNASDRSSKVGFEPVDGRDVLARLVALPLSTWSYKSEDESVRHLGPMAQDFAAAFGLGADDRSISTVDAAGVALAAIQGLNDVVESQKRRIDTQNDRIAELEAELDRMEAIERRVEALETR